MVAAMARVDHRQSARAKPEAERLPESGQELRRSHREGMSQGLAVDAHRSVDLVTRKHEKTRDDATGLPAEAPGGGPGCPLVPAELSLDRAKVVEPRLDLDDQQRACPRLEDEQVDPAM